LDSAQAPQVVIVEAAPCRDAAGARAELVTSLAPATAPGGSWQVKVQFTRSGKQLTGRGDVVNAQGVSVATRSIATRGSECTSLARGIAVWASLVLDLEVERARAAAPDVIPDVPPDDPGAAQTTSLWPTTAPAEPVPPEASTFLRHGASQRTVELGLETFVMGGTASGVVVGPTAYGVFETSHGIFLRPTLLAGHSIGQLTAVAPGTFVGSRFDACFRLPGMYLDERGIQLDLCGGGELGFLRVDSGVVPHGAPGTDPTPTQAFLAVGPSLDLRGELGSSLSAVLRGVADANLLGDSVALANGGTATSSLLVWRAEVGLSWRLR
jgi:hypothetical protein